MTLLGGPICYLYSMPKLQINIVGLRVNLIRAQRTLAGLEAQKLFRPNILEVERLGTRIRGLRDLRVLGSRIRGFLFENFSDDKGLEFVASET
jgi:hypothetical protein